MCVYLDGCGMFILQASKQAHHPSVMLDHGTRELKLESKIHTAPDNKAAGSLASLYLVAAPALASSTANSHDRQMVREN